MDESQLGKYREMLSDLGIDDVSDEELRELARAHPTTDQTLVARLNPQPVFPAPTTAQELANVDKTRAETELIRAKSASLLALSMSEVLTRLTAVVLGTAMLAGGCFVALNGLVRAGGFMMGFGVLLVFAGCTGKLPKPGGKPE